MLLPSSLSRNFAAFYRILLFAGERKKRHVFTISSLLTEEKHTCVNGGDDCVVRLVEGWQHQHKQPFPLPRKNISFDAHVVCVHIITPYMWERRRKVCLCESHLDEAAGRYFRGRECQSDFVAALRPPKNIILETCKRASRFSHTRRVIIKRSEVVFRERELTTSPHLPNCFPGRERIFAELAFANEEVEGGEGGDFVRPHSIFPLPNCRKMQIRGRASFRLISGEWQVSLRRGRAVRDFRRRVSQW